MVFIRNELSAAEVLDLAGASSGCALDHSVRLRAAEQSGNLPVHPVLNGIATNLSKIGSTLESAVTNGV